VDRLPFGLLALPRDAKKPEKKAVAAEKKQDDYSVLSPEQKRALQRIYGGFYGLHDVLSEARVARAAGREQDAEPLLKAVIYYAKSTYDQGDFRHKMKDYEVSPEPKLRECCLWLLEQQKEMRALRRFLDKEDRAAAHRKDNAAQFAGDPMDMHEEIEVIVGNFSSNDKNNSFKHLANFAREMPEKFNEKLGALLASDDEKVRETAKKFVESPVYKDFDTFLKRKLAAQGPELPEKPPKMKAL